MRVLVVDDSHAEYETIARKLDGADSFHSKTNYCRDGLSCCEALSSENVDCILLDYRLAWESGLEVLAMLRAAGHDHPVILLTGQGDERVAEEAMRRGCQSCLSKDDLTELALRRAVFDAVDNVVLERRLREKQRELEGFVSGVAHDLRNPLCSALDSVQVIRDFYSDRCIDDRGMTLIGGAVTSLQRMSQLIDALLDYAWTGRDNAPQTNVDLNVVAAAVAADLRLAIKEHDAKLDIGVLPEVVGDPVALRQLLQNLIANGIKFRGESAPSVSVLSRSSGCDWVISVCDNGIGIAADNVRDIFQPFRRLHLRNEFDGSGLGLATCQRIVEGYGGRIWVESTPGEGSSFHFTCPKPKAVVN